MESNKWQAHRAGILNYWYYDEAEFEFADGRLMLRGSNGSGKSVTMQSLVTVLLDGVKRADRLDSFGSRSRRIEDYLLGEKEISSYEERTGYLYLEYKREHSDQYVTTGIGLHARRGNTKVDFWGFLLQNGRRIGKDFYLYKQGRDPETGRDQRIPLSRRELENAIGQDGRVTTEQREYMAMVNQHVFGYRSLEQYEELMQLLIQLRSPKLSRDFRPSVIYEILNDSLPVLSEEDLRPLSETLENMERTKLSIEQLEREKRSLDNICQAYDRYNRAVLSERCVMTSRYEQILSLQQKKMQEAEVSLQDAQSAEQEAIRQQQALSVEAAGLQEEQENLRENEAYKAARSKEEKSHQLQELQSERQKKEKELKEKRRRELETQGSLERGEARIEEQRKAAEEWLEELETLADFACFRVHRTMAGGFSLSDEKVQEHFRLWEASCREYEELLTQLRRMLQQYERLQERNVRLETELSAESQQLDRYRREQERLLDQLEEERSRLVKEYYEWKKGWEQIIVFPTQEDAIMAGMLQGLYRDAEWKEVQALLRSLFGGEEQKLHAEMGAVRATQETIRQKQEAVEEALRQLYETKEAEPELSEACREARKLLSDRGIPHLSLYEAAEFRDTVDEKTRERMEAALLDAGLLTAVILPENQTAAKLPEEMTGSILFSGEPVMMAESLVDYLQPVPGESGISASRIADILGCIRVDDSFYAPEDQGVSINIRRGAYRLGNLAGHAVDRDCALYIGKTAREAYRRQQIAEKEAEREALQSEAERLRKELEEWAAKLQSLRDANAAFPEEQVVREVFLSQQAKAREIELQLERVQKKDEEKKQLALDLRELQREIREARGDTGLEFSTGAYEQAQSEMGEYRDHLRNLQLVQRDFAHAEEQQKQFSETLDYLRQEADALRGEILSFEMEEKKISLAVEALERQLKELDAEAIEKRIAEVAERLRRLPAEQRGALEAELAAKNAGHHWKEVLNQIQRRRKIYELLVQNWKKLLQTDLKRGFLYSERPEQKVLQELENSWKKEQEKENPVTVTILAGRLQDAQYREQGMLMEYRMSLHVSEESLAPMPELVPEDEELFTHAWQELREKASRSLLLIEADGRQESPYEQRDWLKNHLEEQKNLLSEQDKRIYQEIIMNSIGRTISDRIYGAEAWISKMNGLMRQSETSSGLKFRLEWKAVRTEDDNELDASELVELLHADPESLKEEDMQRIVQHFQTRIERARAETEGDADRAEESFQTRVRELLDYRKWFHFQLYFDQGEKIQKRELTDRAFFRFSGGEKAMAMYVPLFSAAYSRYQEAGKDAPYLITLDEAFAGVDEQNMRDMFHLVEQLHFNYIMNSQAIWGDYDVVPSLNIYELLRPLNASYVTVAGYHWDGKRRMVMMEEDGAAEE